MRNTFSLSILLLAAADEAGTGAAPATQPEATTQPEVSPMIAREEQERLARLAQINADEKAAREAADRAAAARAAIEAVARAPRDVHALAADARDATLAYLDDHKDTSSAAQPFRAMLMAQARLFDQIAAMK